MKNKRLRKVQVKKKEKGGNAEKVGIFLSLPAKTIFHESNYNELTERVIHSVNAHNSEKGPQLNNGAYGAHTKQSIESKCISAN